MSEINASAGRPDRKEILRRMRSGDLTVSNKDGWQDIYVSNDFFERDYLYLNNGDGTFSEVLEEQIGKLRDKGLTVLLAEQNQRVALRLSDGGYVIDNGVIRYHGSIEDLRENEEVRKKYLLV